MALKSLDSRAIPLGFWILTHLHNEMQKFGLWTYERDPNRLTWAIGSIRKERWKARLGVQWQIQWNHVYREDAGGDAR